MIINDLDGYYIVFDTKNWNTELDTLVICLCGRMDVVIYEEVVAYIQNGEEPTSQVSYNEIDRVLLCPAEGIFGCSIPKGAWHTVEVFEPTVIFEAKNKAYGEDGSEVANVD